MPIIKWAKKALKQSKKKAARNLAFKKIFTESRKAFEEAIKNKDVKAAKAIWVNEKKDWKTVKAWLQAIIDKLAKKNIIHKNNASRKKAKYAKMLKELSLNSK